VPAGFPNFVCRDVWRDCERAALAVVVIGLFALKRLGVDLLPHIIYPEVRVRILDPGVPGKIMEDQITRQLEEQLAITEDAIGVQSQTSEGRSEVDLTFDYGKDIDVALRDASRRSSTNAIHHRSR
jgi:multidrug efflux pump subunit AcrB